MGAHQRGDVNLWCYASRAEVEKNMASTGFPLDRLMFVPGKVEETIPASAPERTALLRLDTDWYESTYHELVHLYPRLQPGGVLILDDYGHFEGARGPWNALRRERRAPCSPAWTTPLGSASSLDARADHMG